MSRGLNSFFEGSSPQTGNPKQPVRTPHEGCVAILAAALLRAIHPENRPEAANFQNGGNVVTHDGMALRPKPPTKPKKTRKEQQMKINKIEHEQNQKEKLGTENMKRA